MKLQGPIEVEVKVAITNGEDTGVATLGLGKGAYPNEDEIRKAVSDLEKELPEGFRLMNKREYWDAIMPPPQQELDEGERPLRWALPGGSEWDA